MKKAILLFILIGFCFPPTSKAQMNQGKVLIGLSSRMGVYSLISSTSTDIFSLGFSSIKSKSDAADFEEDPADKMSSINFQPKIGIFVIDNLALGLDFSLATFKYKEESDDDETTISTFGVGPFIRYYLPAEKIAPFFEANAVFGSRKYKWDPSDEDKSSLFAIGGGAGVAVPLGDKVTFDLLIGYNSYEEKDKEDNEDNFRTVTGTFGIKFGFIVFIGKSR